MFQTDILSLNIGPSFNFDTIIQKSHKPTILKVKNELSFFTMLKMTFTNEH